MATKKISIKQMNTNGELDTLYPKTTADQIIETDTAKVLTSAERTKLAGVESGAEVNTIETIKVNGVAQAITNKAVDLSIDMGDYIPVSEKGANGGVATLDTAGKIPTSQLPGYVDDVLEYNAKSNFPTTGETGKIYVAKDTNLTYRWSGSAYVEISASLALGETSSTAYAGNKGKANADAITALGTRVGNIENNTTLIKNEHGGFAGGEQAGSSSEVLTGGAVGDFAKAGSGGAVGASTRTMRGGAVGCEASSVIGGAVGYQALAGDGGAVGYGAIAEEGFSGGKNAKVLFDDTTGGIDAIQLGTGTNSVEKSLQIYDDNIYNAQTHTLDVKNIKQNGADLFPATTAGNYSVVNVNSKGLVTSGGTILEVGATASNNLAIGGILFETE